MTHLHNSRDVIAAIATPGGRGGVGIVRLSGADLEPICRAICGTIPSPRTAHYVRFLDSAGQTIDQGIAIYFRSPRSFTGEDVLELHGHGGTVVMDMLVQRCLQLGARHARPGEFSERAFLNGKVDLAQAEAIADLIDASSLQAARSAMRSLEGEFSRKVHAVINELTELRVHVEAAIDFPEEEIDFLADSRILKNLSRIEQEILGVLESAQQGALLREGMTVVLAGEPNAGKSSLLNALSGRETAIVTDVPGTTRDVLREQITLHGMPLHVVDTAGLRDSADVVEVEGIRRAWREIEAADLVLFIVDLSEMEPDLDIRRIWPEYFYRFGDQKIPICVVLNKIDKTGHSPGLMAGEFPTFAISAARRLGLDELVAHIEKKAGLHTQEESAFSARRRHLDAIERALQFIVSGRQQLLDSNAGELLAEDLRQAQQCLGEITGEVTTEDILGRIFSSFCIGK